jgi:hypothetical protein
VERTAPFGKSQPAHIPAELEFVRRRAAGIEVGQRPARGYVRGSGEDDLDTVSRQVFMEQRAVGVGSDLGD